MTSALNEPPLNLPDGYRTFTDEFQGPLFDDPVPYGVTDLAELPAAARVVLIHELCGCPVVVGFLGAHEAWHASLGS